KREPVHAYAVLGLGEATTPMALAAERGLTPFVGRGPELAQIESCFRRLHEHYAQVVAIVGDAGSGKSRLVYEFKQRLAGEPVVFFEARCSAWNQMLPYAPFAAMLRQYFGLIADEPAGSACERIARKLRPWDPNLDQIYPYICHMLTLSIGPGR